MRAVLQYRASPGFIAELRRAAPDWLEVDVVDVVERERFADVMTQADVLLHVLEPVTAAVLRAAPELKLVQKLGVGVNTIDLEVCRELGIGVANMPGVNTASVVETTLALLLAVLRRVPVFHTATRAGTGWEPDLDLIDATGEIRGRTVGLVGYGAIGQALTPVLQALGATVVYTATAPKDGVAAEWRSFDELLAEADVVSLHLPLTADNAQMMNAAAFAAMRPGAIFVNTARGGLVDEAALLDALDRGHLGGAGLDVFAQEPVDPANPLLGRDDVVVLPHLGWLTPESLARAVAIAYRNCAHVRAGEPLDNEIVPVRRR